MTGCVWVSCLLGLNHNTRWPWRSAISFFQINITFSWYKWMFRKHRQKVKTQMHEQTEVLCNCISEMPWVCFRSIWQHAGFVLVWWYWKLITEHEPGKFWSTVSRHSLLLKQHIAAQQEIPLLNSSALSSPDKSVAAGPNMGLSHAGEHTCFQPAKAGAVILCSSWGNTCVLPIRKPFKVRLCSSSVICRPQPGNHYSLLMAPVGQEGWETGVWGSTVY